MNNLICVNIVSPEAAFQIAEIGRITFYETWRSVNTEEDMQLYISEAFDDTKIKADVADSEVNLFLLAKEADRPIGYAKMRRDRTYAEFNDEKAIEVERIYVKREYQKRKIGKLLMDHCIERAKEEKNCWIWLGVNDENHSAIEFYKKYGFEIFGTKQFKLGKAVDTDYLMKLKLI